MNIFRLLVLPLLLIAGLFTACGPSEEELSATSTAEMASLVATQTAGAPTPTPEPTATSLPTPTSTPTLAPTPTPFPVRLELENSLEALQRAEAYHFRMDMHIEGMTGEGTELVIPMVFEGDFQSPDRMQGVMTINVMEEVLENEAITIGDQTYVFVPEYGVWQSAPANEEFTAATYLSAEPVANLKDIALVAEESLAGTRVYHITAILPSEAFADTLGEGQGDFEVAYWIGVEDGLPHKFSLEGALVATDMTPGLAEDINLIMTVELSDYGKSVTIEAPVSTSQEVPKPSSPELGVKSTVECDEAPEGYLAFSSARLGIAFCYPEDWVLEDLVEMSGSLALSPTGYGTLVLPAALILIFPHESMAPVNAPTTSVEDVLNVAISTFELIAEEAQFDEEVDVISTDRGQVATLVAQGTLASKPLVGILSGFRNEQAVAMAIGFLFDEETHQLTVETILDSVVIGLPRDASASEPLTNPVTISPAAMLPLSDALQQLGPGWRHYTVDDGLAANNTTSMAVAADGALWFGSAGAGVSRFDGETWTTYTSDDGLIYNYVYDIAAAPDGSMWFATQHGLSHWQDGNWTSYSAEDGLPGRSVCYVAIDLEGKVWATSHSLASGVASFDGISWTTYITVPGAASIVVSPDGLLWFATRNGVIRFDGQVWKTYTTNSGLLSNTVVAIAIDPDGMVWAATSIETGIGFSRFDGVGWITQTTLDAGPSRAFAITKDGTLLFGGEMAVYRYDGGDWTELTTDDGSVLRAANATRVTSDGAEWFVTRFGVFRYKPAE